MGYGQGVRHRRSRWSRAAIEGLLRAGFNASTVDTSSGSSELLVRRRRRPQLFIPVHDAFSIQSAFSSKLVSLALSSLAAISVSGAFHSRLPSPLPPGSDQGHLSARPPAPIHCVYLESHGYNWRCDAAFVLGPKSIVSRDHVLHLALNTYLSASTLMPSAFPRGVCTGGRG